MLAERLNVLESQAVAALEAQGYPRNRIETQPFLNLRYAHTDGEIVVVVLVGVCICSSIRRCLYPSLVISR